MTGTDGSLQYVDLNRLTDTKQYVSFMQEQWKYFGV